MRSSSATAATACSHCGLPVPAGLVVAGEVRQFCCAGCRAVYHAIAESGLERYYQLADGERRPAVVTSRRYRELDDPAFARLHVRPLGAGLARTTLYLEGVHCTACVWLTERLPALLPGVVELRLDLGRRLADVIWDPARVSLSAVARRLDSLGYPVHPWRSADRERLRRREDRALWIKIGVAGAAAANIMLLAAALYAGMFADMAVGDTRFFRWASLILAVPAIGYASTPFFRSAVAALRAGRVHLDLPIALGITAGVGWGVVNTIRGRGEIYFDSVSMLVFLLLVARWVQARQHRRAASAAELLVALTPGMARRVGPDPSVVTEVAIEAIAVGDLIAVRAGETIPVDGVVASGRGTIDAALLTGEPRPVRVGPGDPVCAGTVSLSAPLQLRTTATGEDTRVGKLAARIDEEARRRAPIVRAADRIAARFVLGAIGAALVTALAWLAIEPRAAVDHAMALLIVTCPCALGLATPLALSVAIGRAARRGLLIKGGDAVERLAHPGLLLLDKTGTVTSGALALCGWRGDESAVAPAAALEATSGHPLARAMVAAGGAGESATARVSDVCETPGAGIQGRVDGVAVAVGSPRFAVELTGAHLPGLLAAGVAEFAARAWTPVVVCVGDRAVAVAGFGDPVRDDAAAAIATLRGAGWRIGLLSGDDPDVVRTVGDQLGIPAEACRGGASPEDKLAVVRAALADGPVVMVGDGVNDAAALAAATCGIAVHGGAEASLAAADVLCRRPGLQPLVELELGARRTMAVIRRNFTFSLLYNLTGATLAIAGLLHPLIAAVMMPLSSITVVTSSTRTRAFAEDR